MTFRSSEPCFGSPELSAEAACIVSTKAKILEISFYNVSSSASLASMRESAASARTSTFLSVMATLYSELGVDKTQSPSRDWLRVIADGLYRQRKLSLNHFIRLGKAK